MEGEIEKKAGDFSDEAAAILRRVQQIWQEIRESESMLAGMRRQEENFADFLSVDMSGEGTDGDFGVDLAFLSEAAAVGLAMSGGDMPDMSDIGMREVSGRLSDGGDGAKRVDLSGRNVAASQAADGERQDSGKNPGKREDLKYLGNLKDSNLRDLNLKDSENSESGQEDTYGLLSVARMLKPAETADNGDNGEVLGRGFGGVRDEAAGMISDEMPEFVPDSLLDFGKDGGFLSEFGWGNAAAERLENCTENHMKNYMGNYAEDRSQAGYETGFGRNVESPLEMAEVVHRGNVADAANEIDMARLSRDVADILCDALCDELVILLNSRSLV